MTTDLDDTWDFDDCTLDFNEMTDLQIPFGKYRGAAIGELPVDYVRWLLANGTSDWVDCYRDTLERRLTYVDPETVPEYELMEDQSKASEEIVTSFTEDGNRVHRLQGGAGYGKSFACIDVVLRMKRLGFQVQACATSYVATQNLAKDLEPIGVICGTIASTLRLEVVYDGPRERYVPGPCTDIELRELLDEGRLLIVDEYSMVDDTIGQLLVDAAHRYGGRLLVVGDVYQLPSPAQSWDSMLASVEPSSELWLPKRYALDSDLFQVERTARNDPYAFSTAAFAGSDQVVQVRSLPELTEAYVDSHRANPDEQHLMLWYRRVDMAASNRQIRRALFGNDADEICEGEQLRVQRTSDFTPYYGGDGNRVYSGTSFTVAQVHTGNQSIQVDEANLRFDVPVHWVDTTDHQRYAVLFSVTETQAEPGTRGAAEFNEALVRLANWCREHNSWKPYRAFRACFVQVAYQYASTVHRVQGQSVDRIFTSPQALRMADDFVARKLSYVGLTRAKKRLTCL